jgi:hypothetical protein
MNREAKKIIALLAVFLLSLPVSWALFLNHYEPGMEFYTDLLIAAIWVISSLVCGGFSVSIYNKNRRELNIRIGVVAWLTLAPSLIVGLLVFVSLFADLIGSVLS